MYKNGELIDVFGIIGEDPGSSWKVEERGTTVDHTLVRYPHVFKPTTTWDASEWDVYPKDTFTYLGKHTMESGQSDFGKFQIDLYPKVNGAQDKTILEGQSFDPLEGITAVDDTDGECAILVEVYDEYGDPVLNYGDFSDLEVGAYTITYAATNSLSNTTVATITLTITEQPVETEFTETFDNRGLSKSYADGQFEDKYRNTWVYGHSRDEDDYPIDGTGLMLRRASDSYLEITFVNGVDEFSFQYRKAFTGANARQLEVYVNGDVVAKTDEFGASSGRDDDIYTFNYRINISGKVIVKIKNEGTSSDNRQTVIDNVTWTSYGSGNPQ